MGKPIALPDITGVLKAIEVILDPAKSKEYATALKSQIDEYQSLVDEYRKWKSLDDAEAQATAKSAEAKRLMDSATETLAKAKEKAESIVKGAVTREIDINAKLRDREVQIAATEAVVVTSRNEIKALRAEAQQAQEEAVKLRDQYTLRLAEANAIKADYEGRLEKLKGLAA